MHSSQGKYVSDYDESGEGLVTDDDESIESNRRPSRRIKERKTAVCRHLAELTCPFLSATQLRDVNTSLDC